MPYQFKKEPLRAEEADGLANACNTPDERLVLWALLDTGLRVSELCSLTGESIQWQQRAIRVKGKGGPFGKRSKIRVVPLSHRVRALLEPSFALNQEWFVGPWAAQKIVKRVANRAQLTQDVTPHILRHYTELPIMPSPRRSREGFGVLPGDLLRHDRFDSA